MDIVVNGQARQVSSLLTLAGLIQELQLPAARLAIELNRQLVPRPEWAARALAPGDQVEIVQFVGGGC